MKIKKYAKGGKPPVDPKKPLNLDASAKKSVQSRPVSSEVNKKYAQQLKQQLPSGKDWAEMKRKEQALNPSYPELLVMSGINAIKGATTAAHAKAASSFDWKKAAALFGADLAFDDLIDRNREDIRKK